LYGGVPLLPSRHDLSNAIRTRSQRPSRGPSRRQGRTK
jgi:hypothetical protein